MEENGRRMECLQANKRALQQELHQKISQYNQDFHLKKDALVTVNHKMKTQMITKREQNLLRQEDAYFNRLYNRNEELGLKASYIKK